MSKTTKAALPICAPEQIIRQNTTNVKRALRCVKNELAFLKLQYAHYVLHPDDRKNAIRVDETKTVLQALREHLQILETARQWLTEAMLHELDHHAAIEKEFSAQFQALLGHV